MIIIDSNTLQIIRWLKFNVEPLNLILIKWKESIEYRIQFLNSNSTTIANILENWPIYKQAFYYIFVLIVE